MADLKPSEVEKVEFSFNVFASSGLLDGFYLPKVLRSLNINASLDQLEKIGATAKEGEKKYKLEDVLPMYSQLKKEKKNHGCYEDFIECLKLYDKNENGRMPVGELSYSLLNLGEKLTDPEVDELFEDCLDEENDEGEIEYNPFLRRMCELDPPLNAKPEAAAKKK